MATGAALVVVILTFGPISGAPFNPAVTVAAALQRRLPWRDVPSYVSMQIIGAFAGVASANVMFGLPAFFLSGHPRDGWPLLFSECIATLGLILVIAALRRSPEMTQYRLVRVSYSRNKVLSSDRKKECKQKGAPVNLIHSQVS
ncbi:MAG: aquaporin, partial [Chthoniobacterales bacterium]